MIDWDDPQLAIDWGDPEPEPDPVVLPPPTVSMQTATQWLLASPENRAIRSARDLDFLRSLALCPDENRTAKQSYWLHKILGRYHRSLATLGIDYAQFPEPPEPGADTVPDVREVTLDDGVFAVRFKYFHDLVRLFFYAACVPHDSYRRVGGLAMYRIPVNAPSAELVSALPDQYGFTLGPGVIEAALKAIEEAYPLIAKSRAREPESLAEIPGFGLDLYPFQLAGIEYAAQAKRCIIGDQMGLGKTRQFLGVVALAQAFPAIMVCPALVKPNWHREATAAFPSRRVVVINSQDPVPLNADVVIVNYDILADRISGPKDKRKEIQGRLKSLLALNAKAVGFDEAHKLRNPRAKRTKACVELAEGAEYRLALTGTPFVNRPKDGLSLLEVVGRLEDFGGARSYLTRYCGDQEHYYQGAANLGELNNTLRQTCYVRRLKSEVLPQLPPKRTALVPVDLSDLGRTEYDKAESELIQWMIEQEAKLEAIQNGTYQLAPGEAMPKYRNIQAAMIAEQLMRIGILRQLSAKYKMDAVREWVEDFVETGEKLVLFAWHKAILADLHTHFKAPVITGDVTPNKRQEIIDRFQTDPDLKLILLNIEAGGVGITLTAASNVVFHELPWTPAEVDQALDRCHRIGQTDSVTGWFLNARNTIDDYIWDVIEEKRAVVTAAADGASADAVEGAQRAVISKLRQKGGLNGKDGASNRSRKDVQAVTDRADGGAVPAAQNLFGLTEYQ